ncbi:hypothetical protein GCM10010528_24260 [Gordonia defluvii]|jgi:deazaflavin-dependent oxidoreductase (nitroreductase family)|uniref:Nitroreductase family deazaflavin-dependent oxidoreductase n=1 Tax=Gordonia defluvii TaxID=283718 RepID=A0ABP6LJ25_9ACTN|nr:nitroreductase/quinone reductase family protein [Gordonia sp. UBA5067]
MTGSTHYIAPSSMDRAFNTVVRWLAQRGIGIAGSQALTVVGRTSGQSRTVPVNPLAVDGSVYLVAVRGETDWVRNARVAGSARLGRGRRQGRIGLTEVPDAQRAPVIAAYLRKWGWEVGRFLPGGVTAGAGIDELAAVAHLIPVFVVS